MKTLLDKLGYQAGMGAQIWYLPETLQEKFASLRLSPDSEPRFRIAFARDSTALALAATEVAAHYRAGEHLWLCYPKKSGKLRTDLTRDIGWEPIQKLGLYGVTQIAIDEDWSGLRFRYRDEIASFTRRTPTGG